MVDKLFFRNIFYRRGLTNTTPFTYRDGITFLDILEEIKSKIVNEIIPSIGNLDEENKKQFDAIQSNFVELDKQWTEQLNNLDLNDVRAQIAATRLDTLRADVESMVANLGNTYATDAELESARATITQSVESIKNTLAAQIADEKSARESADSQITTSISGLQNDMTQRVNTVNSSVNTLTDNIRKSILALGGNFLAADNEILFIGDSYGTGCQEGGVPYVKPIGDIVASEMSTPHQKWIARNYCVDESGYVTVGKSRNFGGQFDKAVNDGVNPKIVCIIGGRNDRGNDVYGAAFDLIIRIKTQFPGVKVVCFPLWSWEKLTHDYYVTLTSIVRAASMTGAVFDGGSLYLGVPHAQSQWSGVHPSLTIAYFFARAITSLIDGGTLNRTHYFKAAGDQYTASYWFSGVQHMDTVTINLSANLGSVSSPVLGRLPTPVLYPNSDLYMFGLGGGGRSVAPLLFWIKGDGEMSVYPDQPTQRVNGDYIQLQATYQLGRE